MSRDIESEVAGFRRNLDVSYTVHVVLEQEFDNYVRRHAGSSWSFALNEDGSREYSVPGFPEFVVHGVFKRKHDCPEAIEPFLRASVCLDQETIVSQWLWRSDVFKNLNTTKEKPKEALEKGYRESLKILEHIHPGHALHVIANEDFLDWVLDKRLITRVSDSGITYKLRSGREVVVHCTYTGAAHSWNWVKGGATSGPEWDGVSFDDFSDAWDDDPRGYEELGKFLEDLNRKEAAKAKPPSVKEKEMAEEAIYQGAVAKLRDNARSGRILHTAMRHEFLDRLLKEGVLKEDPSSLYKGAPVYWYTGKSLSAVAVHATYDGRPETPSLWVGGESAEYCKAFKEHGWACIGRDWQYDKRSQSELGKFLVEMNSGPHGEASLVSSSNKTSETAEPAEPAAEKESDMNKNEFGKVALRGVAGAAIDMAVTEIGVALIKEHPESAEFLLSPLGRAVLMMAMFGATETVARATGANEDSTASKVLGVMSEVFVSEGARAATTGVAKPLMAGGHWVAKTLGATLPKLRAVDTSSMMSDEDSGESTMKGTV